MNAPITVAASASLPERVTPTQAARPLGIDVSTLLRLRYPGSSIFDPTFPKMSGGTYSTAELLAWKAKRDSKPAPTAEPPAPPTDRRATPDRRKS